MIDILVIPDSHNKPKAGTDRWKALGAFAAARQPDVIVNLGDHWDMPSLCSYDEGTADWYARNYNDDVRAGEIALEKMAEEMTKKAPKYNPTRIMLGGNHDEGRIEKLLDKDPRWEGRASVDELKKIAGSYGYKWIEFGKKLEIADIYFSHYFVSGVMGRPISGENPAANMLKKQYASCVAGHLHLWDYAERTHADGHKVIGICAGCFLEPGQVEKYAKEAQLLWRNGVTMLYDAKRGEFDHEFISVERLRRLVK